MLSLQLSRDIQVNIFQARSISFTLKAVGHRDLSGRKKYYEISIRRELEIELYVFMSTTNNVPAGPSV